MAPVAGSKRASAVLNATSRRPDSHRASDPTSSGIGQVCVVPLARLWQRTAGARISTQ
jgi:hypothetical protein